MSPLAAGSGASGASSVFSGVCPLSTGAWGGIVVKVLRFKSEGPGIDSRCRRGFW
jgi:hypothetical protein